MPFVEANDKSRERQARGNWRGAEMEGAKERGRRKKTSSILLSLTLRLLYPISLETNSYLASAMHTTERVAVDAVIPVAARIFSDYFQVRNCFSRRRRVSLSSARAEERRQSDKHERKCRAFQSRASLVSLFAPEERRESILCTVGDNRDRRARERGAWGGEDGEANFFVFSFLS